MAGDNPADPKQRKNRGGRQFVKGQSGNPKGRPPKGYSITETFKAMLSEKPEIKEVLARVVLDKAIGSKDLTAIKLIWQYMDGMPSQDVTSGGEKIHSLYDLLASANTKPTDQNPK